MGDINLQLVREFFELNQFQVLTNWQQSSLLQRAGEHHGQLFVRNTDTGTPRDLPYALQPGDVGAVVRAVVDVRAWHGDRFYPSVIEANPVLHQFVSPESLLLASDVFHHEPFTTVLVVSELPASAELRQRSLRLLEEMGIEHVIEFPLILRDMINRVDANGNYLSSDTLQTLRLLKRYKLVRNRQMEFTFTTEAPQSGRLPPVDAGPIPDEE